MCLDVALSQLELQRPALVADALTADVVRGVGISRTFHVPETNPERVLLLHIRSRSTPSFSSFSILPEEIKDGITAR
jgi:hypothetical protein